MPVTLTLPPIQAEASLVPPTFPPLTLVVVHPAGVPTLPVAQPTFTLGLIKHDGATAPTASVELVVIDDSVFDWTIPLVTLTATVELTGTATTVSLPVTGTSLADGWYDWRVRYTYQGATADWHIFPDGYAWGTFQVDTGADSRTQYRSVSYTVSTAADPAPHLWFARPAAGVPGDQVELVGHGFGLLTGSVTVAGLPATVTAWTREDDTGVSYGRRIDPATGVVDCQHGRIVVTVPNAAPPGGPVVVETA